jgi:hypothetical protein
MNTSKNQAAEYDYVPTTEPENRKRTRIPDLTSSEVYFSTPMRGEQTGRLEDISLGGFAVRLDEASGFVTGHELVVCFQEGLVRVQVKYVVAHADVGYRVGLEWAQPRSPAVIDILTRCMNEIYAHIVSSSETR